MAEPLRYPPAPRRDLFEQLHGVSVSDPFRPLEDADDPATSEWVDAENALTRRMLNGPHRDRLVARLRDLHRYSRKSVPIARGGRLFFTENDGTRQQPILYVGETPSVAKGLSPAVALSPAGEEPDDSRPAAIPSNRRVLVDPNVLDPDGTTALTAFQPDNAGVRVAYALSRRGSDLQDLIVHDVDRQVDLPDLVRWVKFLSVAWTNSGDGFFYTRFPEPGTVPPPHESYFCQVWHHRLGDAQAADRLVYARPDAPDVVFEVDVTGDGRELIITSRRGASDKAEVHIVDLIRLGQSATPVAESPRTLVVGFTDGWHFIDGAGGRLYFVTDHGAPRGRIVSFDLTADPIGLREIVAESADTISLAKVAGGRLVVSSLQNASDRLRSFDLDGGDARDIALPGIGTVAGIEARWSDPHVHVGFTSFTTPLVVLAGDASGRRLDETMTTPLPIDPAQYAVTQTRYSSKDGTQVSMFLLHRADAVFPAPVILTGYGGFNISLTPAFDASDFLWLDAGGVIAVANLRGGGEYGEAWHEAGIRERKQNVFDDFIAAAEWLLANERASRGQIAIEGGSNGGLLVGAVMVQRPDLFGAVICRVPVADMLRYHLFTVGRFWIPEYGCADDPDEFAWLVRYSPYHNVRDAVAYPPTLVMTADTDDRVDPSMAKKFAARLQEVVAESGGGPILLRVEPRAGHGAGKPVTKQIDEQADIYEFLFQHLGEAHQPHQCAGRRFRAPPAPAG